MKNKNQQGSKNDLHVYVQKSDKNTKYNACKNCKIAYLIYQPQW